MLALSLTQPWATLVVSGQKLIENRGWQPRMLRSGDRFAIHATKTVDKAAAEKIYKLSGIEIPRPITSALVGVVTFERVITTEAEAAELGPMQARWFFGPVGWVLSNPIALANPVRMGGAMGLWSLADDIVERDIKPQIASAA